MNPIKEMDMVMLMPFLSTFSRFEYWIIIATKITTENAWFGQFCEWLTGCFCQTVISSGNVSIFS